MKRGPGEGMRYQNRGGHRKRQFKILMSQLGWGRHLGRNRPPLESNSLCLTSSYNELAAPGRALRDETGCSWEETISL
jgi:hypothetical protein